MLFRMIVLVLLFPLPAFGYWDNNWDYRTEVTLTSDQVQSDYRVTVQITGNDLHSTYGWSSSGNDLRVIAADDSTPLNYYISSWNQGAEQATIVIRFPNLVAGDNTFYLYYGNDSSSSASSSATTLVSGISYNSRSSTINPSGWEQAYTELGNPEVTGYGYRVITNQRRIENSDLPNGSNTNYVAYMETLFTVTGSGWFYIRLGSDFGRGGELRVDGQTIEAQWSSDLWWNSNWTNNGSNILQGRIRLSSGEHHLEILGSEGGNDGGMALEVCTSGSCGDSSSSWRPFTTDNYSSLRAFPPVNDDSTDVIFGSSVVGGVNMAVTSNEPEYWSLTSTQQLNFTVANIDTEPVTEVISFQLNLAWNLTIESAFWGDGWDCNNETSNNSTCTYDDLPVNPGDVLPPIQLAVSAHNNNGYTTTASYGATVSYWGGLSDADTSDNTVSNTLPIIDPVVPAGLSCSSPTDGLWVSFYDVSSWSGTYVNSASDFQNLVTGYANDNYLDGKQVFGRISGSGNPFGSSEEYMAIFEGYLQVDTASSWTFALDGDDALELLIDGEVKTGRYGGNEASGSPQNAVTLYLEAGYHSIEFRMHEYRGDDSYYLYMTQGNETSSLSVMPANSTVQCGGIYDLRLTSAIQIENDPVNGTSSPKAIPGAQALIQVVGVNEGALSPDADSVFITQAISEDSEFYANGGVTFIDGVGVLSSGLAAGNITYSSTDDADTSFTHTLTPDGEGYDAAVRYFRIQLNGQMNPATDTVNPEFSYEYRIRLK